MNIQHEIQIEEPRFEKMKKKAQQNRYILSVYPGLMAFGIIFSYFDNEAFKLAFNQSLIIPIIFTSLIVFLFAFIWWKGGKMNKTGQELINDFNSICPYISTFSRVDYGLKIAYFIFLFLFLAFWKQNLIGEYDGSVIILFSGFFSNRKIKDPMEWKKVDVVKVYQ